MMRIGFVLMLFVVFVSCTETKKQIYLQDNELSLVAPRVIANTTIIDTTAILTAASPLNGAQIFYTNNGTTPTQESLLYKAPIIANTSGSYRFKSFHPDWKASDVSEVKLYNKGVVTKSLKWKIKAHESYPGLGNETIINQKKGSTNFKDEQWVGFDTIANASITFKEKIYIESLTIGYLIDTKSWIFPPKSVTLTFNQKEQFKVVVPILKEKDLKKLSDIQIPIRKDLNSISILVENTKKLPQWHLGKGLKAWLFMDEFIFND